MITNVAMLSQSSAKPSTASMGTPPQQNSHSKTLSEQLLGGKERRAAAKVWRNLGESMARVNLMKALIKEGMGLAELEEFNLGLSSKFKSSKFRSTVTSDPKVKNRVLGQVMKLKLADEQCLLRELFAEKTRIRKQIAKKTTKNSKPYRAIMKELMQEEVKAKGEHTTKFKKKVAHLKAKYNSDKTEDSEEQEVPQDLLEYKNLTIFKSKKYDELQSDNYEVKIVGNVELTVEETRVLKLHPKFCVLTSLQESQFEHEQEAALAKMRMEINKDEENKNLTEEEIKETQEFEAYTRQVYDNNDKTYDARKRRVTDLQECSKITLPKPLSAEEEAKLELRKKTQMQIFRDYVNKNTGKNGDQRTNLSSEEQAGLKSLQKRISNGEIIVIKTDKSSKLAVTNQEEYKKMGQEHTQKDKKISRQEVINMEETLNGHNRAWAHIWNSGKDHGHFSRIITSKTTHSENIADLYLMLKDHKEGNKTRPTATGCTSNTQGLSNAVAEVLESVSSAEPDRYNCISGEDMLARIHVCNNKITEDTRIKNLAIVTKLQCNHCRIMEMVDCQDTEEHDWDTVLKIPEYADNKPHNQASNLAAEKVENKIQCQEAMASQGVPEPWEPIPDEKIIVPAALQLIKHPCCGQEIKEKLTRSCQICGPGIEKQEQELCLVGSDVKALFPSIKSEKTGKLIREAIQNTSLDFEGVSQEHALAYIAMNLDLTTDIYEIEHLLPTRKSGKETKLKINALSKDWNPQEKFIFKNRVTTAIENKQIIGRVVEIATRALFQNHAYRFGDEIYHQIEGGSIGDRWTGAAAEIVMQDWATKYKKILVESGLEVLLFGGYVDDGRQLTTSLPIGSRYNPLTKKFETTKQAEAEDIARKLEGESTNQRMARTCQELMNSINENLEFTVETPEDFEQEQLPTLDFKIWQEQDGLINHTYYQKPIKTPFVIMARSAMSSQQKIQILANELTRRVSNINVKNNKQEAYDSVVEQFTQELKNSEFNHKNAREIVMSGLRGFKNKVSRRINKNEDFYRAAHKTAHLRARKKLVARETWYKEQEKSAQPSQDEACSTRSTLGRSATRSLSKAEYKNNDKNKQESKIKAVMFVPHTPGSELARKLRENEENLVKITKTKVKIIERAGTKLQDLLTRSNPWKGSDCMRTNCILCFTKSRTEKNKSQDCHQRNIVYETRCLNCEEQELNRILEQEIPDQDKKNEQAKIKLYKYIGESSRSCYERGWEHINDLTQLKSSSHMLKHVLTKHPEQDFKEVRFGMKVIRNCKTSFERQIYESVAIQQERGEHHILNSRSEYNRCSLPRLSTQLGDEEHKKYNEELKQEKEQEDKIESQIRQLRKIRNKERLFPLKSLDAGTKRRKINENNEYITIQEVWGHPEITTSTTRTAENNQQDEHKNKKLRTNENTPMTQTQNLRENSGQIKLTNIRTVNKIIETPEYKNRDGWEEIRDWDKVLREHKERIEQEEREKNIRLENKRKKIESWKLYNLCKEFLEQNNNSWKKRREQQIEEIARMERLEKAKNKMFQARRNQQNKEWEQKIQQGLSLLPINVRQEQEKLEIKQQKEELRTTKTSLWKLKSREDKLRKTKALTTKLKML